MKKSLLIVLALLLTGCAGFQNRVYCSGEEAVFVSWYRGLGVAAMVDAENGRRVCSP